MLEPTLFAVVVRTTNWSPTIGIIMVVCNIFAIAVGKATIKDQKAGRPMPAPNMFGGFGLGAVLGTAALGHVLGAGVILGLTSIGAL
ncbi:MAG: photosystem I reaction center subunit PsaK [Cyanobacteria bacterium P01_F01_bin.86]